MLAFILILLVNICGFLLKYYGFDRYITLLGFRFHLSLILPMLIIFRQGASDTIKARLFHPEHNKYVRVVMLIVLPLVILVGGLYFLHSLDIADPDYFYELGLSSIIDFPMYLIWNLPQLLILGLFLAVVTEGKRFKFLLSLFTMLMLFFYEIIPLGKDQFAFNQIYNFIVSVLLFSLFITWIENVYLFAIFVFSVIWSNILLFGSSSRVLVNLLLAKNYDSWDGFFSVSKALSAYPYIILAGITLVLLLIMMAVNNSSDKGA